MLDVLQNESPLHAYFVENVVFGCIIWWLLTTRKPYAIFNVWNYS